MPVAAPLISRREALARQQAMLLQKAKEAMQTTMPEGQMVSGHYVAPSVFQNMGAALDRSGMLQRGEQTSLDQQQRVLDAEEASAAQSLIGRLGASTSGEDREGNPIQYPAPTGNDRLKLLQEGTNIPSLRDTLTKAMQDQMINEPARQENRGYMERDREDRQKAAVEAAAAKAEEARQRLIDAGENKAMDRTEREALAKQAATDRFDRDRQNSADRRALVEAVAASKQAGTSGANEKPLSTNDLLKVQGKASAVQDAARFAETFKDDYAGPMAGGSRAAGTYSPWATDNARETSAWWNDYQATKNKTRHELFGSALTATEKAEWEKADISPTMAPAQVRKNLARRQELESQAYDKLTRAMSAGTRSGQIDAIKPSGGATGGWGGAPKAGGGRLKFNPATGQVE